MGKITLRLPEFMHDEVRQWARRQGLSMNRFLLRALVEKLVKLEIAKARDQEEITRRMNAALAGMEEDEDLPAALCSLDIILA